MGGGPGGTGSWLDVGVVVSAGCGMVSCAGVLFAGCSGA